jgi:hypothetical protein
MTANNTKGTDMLLKSRTRLSKIKVSIFAALMACSVAQADDVSDIDRLLCSTSVIMLCVEDGECFQVSVSDSDAPQFLIIDVKKKTVKTTEASGEDRKSVVESLVRRDGRIILQGVENNRAYSLLIEESSGWFSAAIARDGMTNSVFGACTDADLD